MNGSLFERTRRGLGTERRTRDADTAGCSPAGGEILLRLHIPLRYANHGRKQAFVQRNK